MSSILITAIVIFFISMGVFLFFYQGKMIYHPQKYEKSFRLILPKNIVELQYKTAQGIQTGFYIPPQNNNNQKTIPKQIWIMFNGNASLALDWLDYLGDFKTDKIGFLLIDYPGYGLCEGRPSKRNITESSEAAFRSLAAFLNTDKGALENDLNIVGFSLGTAAALQFAVNYNPKIIILAAPFTSMFDMAKLSVGPIFSHLLIDRYDNIKRIEELSKKPAPPEIYLFHGEADSVVPFEMGKLIAEKFPQIIKFTSMKNADHGDLFSLIKNKISEIIF